MTARPAVRGASSRCVRSVLLARATAGVASSGATAAAAAAVLAAAVLLGAAPTRVAATSAGRTWKALSAARAPPPREETAFTPCGGAAGRLCLLGGRGSPPSSILTQSAANAWGWTWTSGPPPPLELHHFQGAPRGRCVYAAGAYTGAYPTETAVPDVWAYCDDAADGGAPAWRRVGAMPPRRARGSAGSVWVAGVGLVVVGGVVGGHGEQATTVRWVDVWDGVEREEDGDGSASPGEGWTRLPDLPRARDHFSVVAQGGELWVAGGRDSGAENFFDAVIPEVFSFATNTWRTLSSTSDLPTPRAAASTALIDGGSRLLLAGGEGNGNAYNVSEVLTLRTGVWESVSRLVKGRHGTGAAVCGGAVYVAAGSGGQGGSEPNLNTLEGLWAGDGPPPRCGGGAGGGEEETTTTPSPSPPPEARPEPTLVSSGGGGDGPGGEGGSVSESPSPNLPSTSSDSSGSEDGTGGDDGGDNGGGNSGSGSDDGGGNGGATSNGGGGGSVAPLSPSSSPIDSEDGESACFPAAATVQLASGVTVTMDALRVGDVVLDAPTGGGDGVLPSLATTRVLFFTHADGPSRVYPVVVLSTVTAATAGAGGENSTAAGRLTLSPDHLVVTADGRRMPASAVTVGTALLAVGRGGVGDRGGGGGGGGGCDTVITAAEACVASAVTVATVTGVAAATAAGRYNPQTTSGTLLVDGHVVSAYTSAVGSGAVAHAGVRVLGWAVAAVGGWGEGEGGRAGGRAGAALAAAMNALALWVVVPTVGWLQRSWAKGGWEGGARALAMTAGWKSWGW